MSGFNGAFATGVACQQGTLTLPDTWFRPPFWDLLMLQLLRPNSSNLPCLYSTFHLEYPLVLSRFCSTRPQESPKSQIACVAICFRSNSNLTGLYNMSGKFDEEARNSLVSIVFTSLFPYMCIVNFTFNLHAPCTDRTTAALQYSLCNALREDN